MFQGLESFQNFVYKVLYVDPVHLSYYTILD